MWMVAGELLGLPEIPAFMDTVDGGVDILHGVNYASAAGGILEETGRHLVLLLFFLSKCLFLLFKTFFGYIGYVSFFLPC